MYMHMSHLCMKFGRINALQHVGLAANSVSVNYFVHYLNLSVFSVVDAHPVTSLAKYTKSELSAIYLHWLLYTHHYACSLSWTSLTAPSLSRAPRTLSWPSTPTRPSPRTSSASTRAVWSQSWARRTGIGGGERWTDSWASSLPTMSSLSLGSSPQTLNPLDVRKTVTIQKFTCHTLYRCTLYGCCICCIIRSVGVLENISQPLIWYVECSY